MWHQILRAEIVKNKWHTVIEIDVYVLEVKGLQFVQAWYSFVCDI